MVAQFAAKTKNSEKAIYFLSLMSCSTNKLKCYIFFTWKNFLISDFTKKKNVCSRKWYGCWRLPCPPPFSTALIYIHRITLWKTVTKNSNELFLSTSLLDPIIFSDDKSVLFISRHKKNYFELLILNQ